MKKECIGICNLSLLRDLFLLQYILLLGIYSIISLTAYATTHINVSAFNHQRAEIEVRHQSFC